MPRAMGKDQDLPPIPTGLLRVLVVAATTPDLRARLVKERTAAAIELGFTLTTSERQMLDSVAEQVLVEMIDSIPSQASPPQRPAHDFPAPGGCAHDLPHEPPDFSAAEGGIRAQLPPERPVENMVSRGISPRVPQRMEVPERPDDEVRVGGIRPELPDGRPRSFFDRLLGRNKR